MAEWKTPKTDWVTNPKNPVAEDFNRIECNIEFLKEDIETKKGFIVSAINAMGQSANITDTHAQLAAKIKAISSDANADVSDVLKGKTFYAGGQKRTGTLELTGDATAAQVLSGYTFYNTNPKSKLTGAMPNRGAMVITPSVNNQAIPAGYHNGSGYVKGDSNLTAANIKKGVSIFGVTGTLASVKSVQRGITGINYGQSSIDVTISPIVVNNSAIFIHTPALIGNPCRDIFAGQIINNTTIRLIRGNGSVAAGSRNIYWSVVEFDNVRSRQVGTKYMSGMSTTITFQAVNPEKSLVVLLPITTRNSTSVDAGRYALSAYVFDSSTQMTIHAESDQVTVYWQILEFI